MPGRVVIIAGALAASLALAPHVAAKQGDRPARPDKPAKVKPGKARAPLTRIAGSADEDAKGRIDVAIRPGNRLDLRIKGQRLDPGLLVDVTIQGSGDEEVLLDAEVTNDEGCVKLKLRTQKGDVLPLGATSLDDLVGATVRVRDDAALADAAPLLQGTVPAIGADMPRRLRLRSDLELVDGQVDGGGRVQALFRGKDVRSELRMKVNGLADGDDVRFMMDDGTGTDTFVEIGAATADVDGEVGYRSRTHHGDALPFGAATVLDLLGRAVRVDVNGAARLTGAVPSQN